MIKATIYGHLCFDPELRTARDTSVCSMRIGARTAFKDDKGAPVSQFVDVVAWRGLAENCAKYLKKGSAIVAEGNVRMRTFTDKNGVERTNMEITADNVEFVNGGANQNGNSAPAPAANAPAPAATAAAGDEDMPF